MARMTQAPDAAGEITRRAAQGGGARARKLKVDAR
jgi:hypothetical protein